MADREVARIIAATAWAFKENSFSKYFPHPPQPAQRRILIGRDTRASGESLEKIIASAFTQVGFSVSLLGVLPTPGVAYLTAQDPNAILGVMISASHNPAEYNGIKFIASTGAKVSKEFEDAVSEAYWSENSLKNAMPGEDGDMHQLEQGKTKSSTSANTPDGIEIYTRFLINASHNPERLKGRKVVLDTANGATCQVAQKVFCQLGADVISIGNQPDGNNINDGCGALHPEMLAQRVVEENAFLGFAFDGDGDRMIPVTENGTILDGDHVMAIAARHYHSRGQLPLKTVVTTVMSNIGLEKSLAEEGLKLIRTQVGDRFVYEAMNEAGHPLGGEQSGHLIFLNDVRTGDGILAAIRLVDCLDEKSNSTLEAASRVMKHYPQVLKNYRVLRKVPLDDLEAVQYVVERIERQLAGDGRIVLRYSGTEPLVRVMVEGPDQGQIERQAEEIGEIILKSISS